MSSQSPEIPAAISRAAVGTFIGLLGACLFLVIGLVRYLIATASGASIAGPADLTGPALYAFGGAAAGAVSGLLFPLAKHKLGAALVGIVAIQPWLYGILLIIQSEQPVDSGADTFAWIMMTLIFGPAIGLSWIRPWHAPDEIA